MFYKPKIKLFDNERNFISDHILNSGDSILLLSGGHGIEVVEETKFIAKDDISLVL